MNEIRINSINDIDTIAKCFDGKLVDSTQVEKGKFDSYFKYKKFTGLFNIFYCSCISKFEVKAVTSSQFYTFYIPTRKASTILNNVQTNNNIMFILPPDFKYQFFLKETSSSYIIQIKKHIIEDKFGKLKYQALQIENQNVMNNLIDLIIIMFKLNQIDSFSISQFMVSITENIKLLLGNTVLPENATVKLFKNIISYMNENYEEELSIKEISLYFDISTRTMRNLFNEMIGCSPKKYLIACKINKLKKEIENNNEKLTISKLMINNNLQFQSQIIKDFKGFFNKTPFEYKKYIISKNK